MSDAGKVRLRPVKSATQYSQLQFCTTRVRSYEGRSINKLQNDTILMIFKIRKFQNICFGGNLIGGIQWNFYDGDVITVTLLVLRTQSVQYIAQQYSLTTHMLC